MTRVAGCGGITRPILHKLLSRKTLAAGATVRLGVAVESLGQDADGVDVVFSDGTAGRYDMVIGRMASIREPESRSFGRPPKLEYTGQSVWRVFTPRPPGIDRRYFFLGRPVKVGFTPVSDEQMYLFVLERTPVGFP